jgi:hypothetical protein
VAERCATVTRARKPSRAELKRLRSRPEPFFFLGVDFEFPRPMQ